MKVSVTRIRAVVRDYENGKRSAVEAMRFISAMFRARAPRMRHFAIMSKYGDIGQTGCTQGCSISDARDHIAEEDRDTLVPIAKKDCLTCKEFES